MVKWTQLGDRPVWTIEVEQPFHVPSLRKLLKTRSWQIFSGDIPFVNRLLPRRRRWHARCLHWGCGGRAGRGGPILKPEIIEAGGGGRYAVDLTVRCDLDNVRSTEPFQVPYTVFSFDLETSIEHETVLCAAACVEDLATGNGRCSSIGGPRPRSWKD